MTRNKFFTLMLFFLCLTAFLAVGHHSLRSYLIVQKPLDSPEALVLLAGSYEERGPLTVSLFTKSGRGHILLTDDGVRRGWSREFQRNLYTTERGVEDLAKRGVPRHAVTALPFRKSGTVYDALAVRDYVTAHNIHSILLVTSDYHSRRSLWTFRKVFQYLPVTIGVAPAPSTAPFVPDILIEYIKSAYYLIRFGVLDVMPVNPS